MYGSVDLIVKKINKHYKKTRWYYHGSAPGSLRCVLEQEH